MRDQQALPEPLRRAYLEALGIDVYVERTAAPVAEPDTQEPTTDRWEGLRAQVAACTACRLHETRTQTVFGVGSANASWMIVGEAPGAEEDRRGEPFVGRAGKLLDEMLRACGLSREQVFIANILKCRPPNNRDPKADESASCRSFLTAQIEQVQPDVLLAVGRIAAQQLLERDDPVGRLRGQVHDYQGRPLVVTYHPAYLLRSPQQKAEAWKDLRLALSLRAAT